MAHSRSTVAVDTPSASRRFIDVEPGEEAQLHDTALPCVDVTDSVIQRLVEGEHVHD